jgi:hypothetical protein
LTLAAVAALVLIVDALDHSSLEDRKVPVGGIARVKIMPVFGKVGLFKPKGVVPSDIDPQNLQAYLKTFGPAEGCKLSSVLAPVGRDLRVAPWPAADTDTALKLQRPLPADLVTNRRPGSAAARWHHAAPASARAERIGDGS